MSNEPKLEYSKIKTLFFHLPDFKWEHSQGNNPQKKPNGSDSKELPRCKPFVGRKALVDKIADYIKAEGGGAYLVTGFRGVGKTTVVNEAIKEAKSNKTGQPNKEAKSNKTGQPNERISDITISLAHEKMEGIDVLKMITKKIYVSAQERSHVPLSDKLLMIMSAGLMILPIFFLLIISWSHYSELGSHRVDQIIFWASFALFLIILLLKNKWRSQANISSFSYLAIKFVINQLPYLILLAPWINLILFGMGWSSYLGKQKPIYFLSFFLAGALSRLLLIELHKYSREVNEKLDKEKDGIPLEKKWWEMMMVVFDRNNYASKIVIFLFGLLIFIGLEEYLMPYEKATSIKIYLHNLLINFKVINQETLSIERIHWSGLFTAITVALIAVYLLLGTPVLRIYSRSDTPFSKIKDLYERLHVMEKTSEEGTVFSFKELLNFSFKAASKRGAVDFRELEDGLLEFLRSGTDYRYVFVFDELDKLNTGSNSNQASTASNQVNGENRPNADFAEKARQRQKALAKILLNLKHFLNHAQAKFVFIAGRELYDADLADVADRDFFWGSIFTEVIYVESLLKTVHHNREHHEFSNAAPTFFIEQFVCLYLIGKYDNKVRESKDEFSRLLYGEEANLKQYSNQLVEFYKNAGRVVLNKHGRIQDDALRKALLFLSDFIIYLTYRSGGLPMKLNKIFEEYVVKRKINEAEDNNLGHQEFIHLSYLKKEQEGYFLQFTYDQQYEIGFVANLYRPFLTQNALTLSFLDDKVLVSIPFLIDHLLKLHDFGFANRNLEQIPELLEPNRAPSLRQFITNLVSYLSIKYIRKIDNSLFNYRFYRTVSNEISFLSKLSAQASAAFNFTLDESLNLKELYLLRLRKSKEVFPFDVNAEKEGGGNDRGHTVSINSYLGDIHFYDKDYDEATAYYANATYTVRKRAPKDITRNQLVSLAKNMLKHGLSLERTRAYDSALGIYGELNRIIFSYFEGHANVEKNSKKAFGDGTLDLENDQFNRVLLKSHFALLLPALAQLAVLEKKSLSGITTHDINYSLRAAEKLLNTKSLLTGDEEASREIVFALFKVKMANLLHAIGFKKNKPSSLSTSQLYLEALLGITRYLHLTVNISSETSLNKKILNEDDLLFFFNSVLINIKHYKDISNQVFQWIADWLNFYGDALLTDITDQTYQLDITWLSGIISQFADTRIGGIENGENNSIAKITLDQIREYTNPQKALFCYLLAAKYNERVQSYRKIISTLGKVLTIVNLFKKVLVVPNEKCSDSENSLIKYLKNFIVQEVVKASIRMYGNNLRINIFEAKLILTKKENMFDILRRFKSFPEIYNTVFNTPEVRECLITMHDIELNFGQATPEIGIGKSLPNPYNNIGSNWARMHSLSHRNNLLRKNYDCRVLARDKRMYSSEDLYCIEDGIFCCRVILQILNLFGASYLVSHYYFAEAHLGIAFWLDELHKLVKFGRRESGSTSIAADVVKGTQLISNWTSEAKAKADQANTTANEAIVKAKRAEQVAEMGITMQDEIKTRAGEAIRVAGQVEDVARMALNAAEEAKKISEANEALARAEEALARSAEALARAESALAIANEALARAEAATSRAEAAEALAKIKHSEVIKKVKNTIAASAKANTIKASKILIAVGKLVGRGDLMSIDQYYHTQQARQHYLACLQVHERSEHTRELISDMYLPEDDFGDEIMHFSIATDRYLINSGFIHQRLSECKKLTTGQPGGESIYSNNDYFLPLSS
jgi:hypothetical protein